MGKIEDNLKKKISKEYVRKAILSTVKVAGLLGVALLAPNALQYMKSIGLVSNKRQKEAIKRSRDNMVRNSFLRYKNGFIELTEKGEEKLSSLELINYALDKPKKWDKKWRLLIFDIPEKKKSQREKLRHTLLEIGFLKIQDSVWAYPYPCEDLVNLLKAHMHIGKDLLYLIVDSIENDSSIRKHFNLNTD